MPATAPRPQPLPPRSAARDPSKPVPQGSPISHSPTVKSQLDAFVGTWTIRGLRHPATMEAHWRGDWLIMRHPAGNGGKHTIFNEAFSYDDSAYVRYDCPSKPRPMFVSGGWVGDRWEWQRFDGSERITYDRIDADTLIITEEIREPEQYRTPYKVVRRFEAHRDLA